MPFEVSVFLDNKLTHFEKITSVLKEENINIRSLSLSGIMQGWGVLNMLVDQPERAYEVLMENGNSVILKEIIALEMKDETGGLDELLIKISRSGIHFENAYSRLITENKMAILILEVADIQEARRRLEVNNIYLLEDEVVYGK